MAFPVVMLLVMGVIQVAHAYVARVVVDYAATQAARAAMVWWYELRLDGLGAEFGQIDPVEARRIVKDRIHAAAALALVPLAPAFGDGDLGVGEPYLAVAQAVGGQDERLPEGHRADTLFGAFDDPIEANERVRAKLRYAFAATRVEIVEGAGGRLDITLSYGFPCQIPLAGRAFGRSVESLGDWSPILQAAGLGGDDAARVMVARTSVDLGPRPNP